MQQGRPAKTSYPVKQTDTQRRWRRACMQQGRPARTYQEKGEEASGLWCTQLLRTFSERLSLRSYNEHSVGRHGKGIVERSFNSELRETEELGAHRRLMNGQIYRSAPWTSKQGGNSDHLIGSRANCLDWLPYRFYIWSMYLSCPLVILGPSIPAHVTGSRTRICTEIFILL